MLVLAGYPIVSNFILSFQDVTVKTMRLANKPFAGLKNYITLFEGGLLTGSNLEYAPVYGMLSCVSVYHRIFTGAVFQSEIYHV